MRGHCQSLTQGMHDSAIGCVHMPPDMTWQIRHNWCTDCQLYNQSADRTIPSDFVRDIVQL